MTRLDIIKLRLKLADLPPLDLISQFPVLPLAPPGSGGPSNPNDVQEAILTANVALVAGQQQALAVQQQAYILQQYFLEMLTECCYQVSILSERFAADYPKDETVYAAPQAEPK